MNFSLPGFPVLHHLPEFAQIHVHWVSDAIQPSHPLSSTSPPTFNLSQDQGRLFSSGGQRIGASTSASVLPVNIQGWFPLGLNGWISLQSKGLSRVFSSNQSGCPHPDGTQATRVPSGRGKSSFRHTSLSSQVRCLVLTWPGTTSALWGATVLVSA